MDREIPLSEQRKAKYKQWVKYGSILTAVVISFFILKNFLRTSADYDSLVLSTVDRGTIEVSVNASGRAVPLIEEIINTPINSRILEVYKNPGETVEKGEAILKLELTSVETEYLQQLDEREIKKGKLVQTEVNSNGKISELRMQEKIKDMQLKQMHTELKNELYLDSLGASTADKIRQAELNYEVVRLELQQLQEKISNECKNVEAEMKVQQLDLNIFDKFLSEKKRLLKDARILSPFNATLTFVNNQIGAQVNAGSQIAIVSDLTRFKIEAEIADSYAGYIRAGARAVVRIGNNQLDGSVLNIIPSSKNGIVNFSVILNEPDCSGLRSGLKTDIFVMTGTKDQVLRIKNGSYYMGEKAYYLWVMNGGKAVRREVRLGECNFDYVEVVSGLKEGDEVVISGLETFGNATEIKIK